VSVLTNIIMVVLNGKRPNIKRRNWRQSGLYES